MKMAQKLGLVQNNEKGNGNVNAYAHAQAEVDNKLDDQVQ